MSKNISRKGIAFGALVALGSSLIAVAPASAADASVTLVPSAGTAYAVPVNDAFSLKTYFGEGAQSAGTDLLKVRIVDASLRLDLGALKTGVDVNSGGTISDAEDFSSTVTAALGTRNATTGELIASVDNVAGVLSADKIVLAPTGSTSFSVTVQTWVDKDGNGAITDGESKSEVQTISFLKESEITWNTSLTTPAIGDAKLEAFVTTSPAINLAQIASKVGVNFTKASTGATAGSSAVPGYEVGTYVAADNTFKVNPTASSAIAAASIYSAQAYYDNNGTQAAADLVGAKVSHETAAAKVSTIANATSAASADLKSTAANVFIVRPATTSVPVSLQVYKVSNTDKAVAGIPVDITVTATALDATSVISAGGKSISAVNGTAKFTAYTDASGLVSFAVSSNTGKATDAFTVSAKAEGQSTAVASSFTWTAASTTAATDLKNLDNNGGNAVLKVAKGANYSLNYSLVDNFGVLTPTSGLRVKVVQTGITPAITRYGTVSNGRATVALVAGDSTTTGTSIINTATLEKYDAATDAWITTGVNVPTDATTVVIGASEPVTAVTVTGTVGTSGSPLALNLNDIKSVDTRLGVAAPTVAGGTVLGGQVSDRFSAGTYSTVTLSGANLLFATAEGVFSAGSITVQTDANGAYAGVSVYSNKAGKQTVTVTAGSVVKTQELIFAAAGVNTGSQVTLVAPTKVTPGSTMTISGVLSDKYGNPVQDASTITYDGPGLLVPSALPTTTDADGKFSFKVILGANETGSATVGFLNHGLDNALDVAGDTTPDDVVISKSININKSSTASASAGSKKITVRAKNSLGETVKVYVDGVLKSTKVATSNNYAITVSGLTAGKHTVKVLVSGKSVLNTRVVATK